MHADDETGADFLGDDEITVTGQADTAPTAAVSTRTSTPATTSGSPRWTRPASWAAAFLTVTEDDPDGDAVGGVISPTTCRPACPSRRARRHAFDVGSGRYALFYNLSGWLRRTNL